MTSETDKNAHLARDGALFGKIETLYREADDLGHDVQSGPLESSARVKSQDAFRLPIIGSMPVSAGSQHNLPNHLSDGSISLSSIRKNGLMTSVVLTGLISRPGAEKEQLKPIFPSGMPLNEPIDNNIATPLDDPFIAIRNAVETAGQTDELRADRRLTVSEALLMSSQTKDLASALAIIIKDQIDNAIEDRLSLPDRAENIHAKTTLSSGQADKNMTASKRAAAKSALKKAATLSRNNHAASAKPKTRNAKPKSSSKKTEVKAKPVHKKPSKAASARDD